MLARRVLFRTTKWHFSCWLETPDEIHHASGAVDDDVVFLKHPRKPDFKIQPKIDDETLLFLHKV